MAAQDKKIPKDGPQHVPDLQSVDSRQNYVNRRLMDFAAELNGINMKESALEGMKAQAVQYTSTFRPHEAFNEHNQVLQRLATAERDPRREVQLETELVAMTGMLKARVANRTQAYWDAYHGLEEKERPSKS